MASFIPPIAQDDEAQRRIQTNLARLSRSGISPANLDPYLGFIHRSSPLGDVLGRGISRAEEIGQGIAAVGASQTPQRLIESFVGLGGKAAENVEDVAKWAVSPRAPVRKKAFVPPENDPQATGDSPVPPPPAPTPPTTAQAIDAMGRGMGIDSSKVPSIERPVKGALGVKMAGGDWIDYNADTSPDVGAPGRGGFVTADVESMPAGNRPPSYFEDRRAQRAIERSELAPGELGGMGFTLEEAQPYLGQGYIRDKQTEAAIQTQRAVEEARYQNEVQRRSTLAQTLQAERADHARAMQALQGMGLPPEELERRKQIADQRLSDAISDIQTSYGVGARMSSNALYQDVMR